MKISAFSITFLALLFHTNGLKVLRKRSPSGLGGDQELSKIFGSASTSSYNSASMGGGDYKTWHSIYNNVNLPVESSGRDFSVKVKLLPGEKPGTTALSLKNGSGTREANVNIRYLDQGVHMYQSEHLGLYSTRRIEIPTSSQDICGYAEEA